MCSCNEGFRLDGTGVICEDVNECLENPYICRVGECVNEEGRFYCLCPEGYMPLPGRSRVLGCSGSSGTNVCFSEECVDMRKDLCFLNYDRGECTTPMTESQSKKVCCCSMGQAWGPCEPCPSQGTSRYIVLLYNNTNIQQQISTLQSHKSHLLHAQVNTPSSAEVDRVCCSTP